MSQPQPPSKPDPQSPQPPEGFSERWVSVNPASPLTAQSTADPQPQPPVEGFSERWVSLNPKAPLKTQPQAQAPSKPQPQAKAQFQVKSQAKSQVQPTAQPIVQPPAKQSSTPTANKPPIEPPIANPAEPPKPDTSYSDKTARIQAISHLIKTLQPLIWVVVLVVVLFPLTGEYLIGQSLMGRPAPAPIVKEIVRAAPDWSNVDRDVAAALQTAELDAEAYASQELDLWLVELEPRVENFLDWYFDFTNQKVMEFKTPFIWSYAKLRHQLDKKQPKAQAAIVANLSSSFEKEFSKRVLVPRNAQLRLENIANGTVDRYLMALEGSLGGVQMKYHLPKGEWNRYLSDISLNLGEDGNLSHLSLKTIAGGGTYLAAKPFIITSLTKLSSKTGAKFASSATSKIAAKAGGSAIAELGATMLDPLAGLGILAWDVLDYRHTVAVDRPILKENLSAYLGDMKQVLLNQPESGVMSSIHELEKNILAKL